MLKRSITDRLKNTIANVPAVALLGARQVGKTTLAQKLAEDYLSVYLDLESPDDIIKLSDPVSFLSLHRNKLIILDEIQRSPDLFKVLRGLIDKNRAAGRKVAQFLLLGSASMDLLRQSSESLAGRISYLEMSGLNALEVLDEQADIRKLWLRGGFPESYLSIRDELSMSWLEDLIRTYLERDISEMGFNISSTRLRRLWTMLAHLQGETINHSKLAGNLDVDNKTIGRYIDILVDLLLVRRLSPWHANVKKRLVKSPRLYIRDSGIQHRLLGINNYDALLSSPVSGKSWEGFVIENIHSVLPLHAETYFYSAAAVAGAEIDLLIKFSSNEVWAIEIKSGSAPRIRKERFNQACQDVNATRKYVVYGGDDEFPIGDGVTVISLRKLLTLIAELK